MKVKEGSEKAGLKLNIQKTKIMASGPLISWQTDREKMETVTDFIFLDSKITTDSDCSHEVKRLAPWKKSYDKSSSVQLLSRVWLFATPWTAACQASLSITNSRSLPKLMFIESVMPSVVPFSSRLDILKSRDITLLTKVHINKAIFFSVVIYGWESWTIMKAERQRIDAFELGAGDLSPLDSKKIKPVNHKGNQSWIFIGRTDPEAEVPILWPPDAKSQLIGKDSDAGKDWGQQEKGTRGWDSWMASPTQWTWVWVNSGSSLWTGRPGVLRFMGLQRVGHNWGTELTDIHTRHNCKHFTYNSF